MLYGAFLGDALGSYVEFEENISKGTMRKVMLMPGFGTHGTDPGQLTDDSELALELGEALLTFDPWLPLEKQLDPIVKQAAINYVRWLDSRPFDIGNTCRAAF
jgi:ADP-ribosyl-[dinitrogen reductase] hydrolase